MSEKFILTIAIPTFNRQFFLIKTLDSMLPLTAHKDIEILVIENCSDDGTWEWLSHKKDKLNLTIIRNVTNFGIEGNIIQALFYAQGQYVWLLSDHMQIHVPEVISFLNRLNNGLEFTFGYARIAEYSPVLPQPYVPFEIQKLDQVALGKLIFFMGNISAFIIKKNYLHQCGRFIFRFSNYSYPHLGVFIPAHKHDTFIELPIVSHFICDLTERKHISYDTFRSRFIGFIKAMEEIRKFNQNFKKINNSLKYNKKLSSALVSDTILKLCFEVNNAPKPFEFAFCLYHYQGIIRLFLLICFFLSFLPKKIRPGISRAFFKILLPNWYKKATQEYKRFFSLEMIKE